MNISVFGLGKLGLPFAATIASRGHQVVGVDINERVVNDLKYGRANLQEPHLSELVKKFKDHIKATTDTKEAILESDLTFIVTPTPSLKNGYFSLKYISAVAKDIAKALKIKKSHHLIVLVSTVMPGSTDQIKQILEKLTGKVCGKDFGLCYNPEFIALGSVIDNLLKPDFILIGESDQKSGQMLQKFYKTFCLNRPKIARMNFINAELTKISVNTFVTTKISYANMIAEICEKLPGGDVDVVTSALGLDSRIGGKYLKGGAAFGGPCFPRDNVAFINLAKNLKVSFDISQATHKTNLKQIERLIEKVLSYCKKNKSVGILGLSYKPFTDVVEESAGLLLAQELRVKKIKLNLHDPLGLSNTQKLLGTNGVNYFKMLKDCVKASDIIVITTNWPEYKNIKKSWFDSDSKVVIDPWRMMDSKMLHKTITYVPLGQSS